MKEGAARMGSGGRRYTLMNYDDPLIEFTLTRDDLFHTFEVQINEVNESARNTFPIELVESSTPDALAEWLMTRTVPRNRRYVDKILRYTGVDPDDVAGLMDVCKGLSVSDAFWVASEGEDRGFEELNLYDNDIDEALSVVAYTGFDAVREHELGLSTEWTTGGSYPKAWRRVDGRLVLYKAGTEGFANAGMEPYSEYFASQVARAMGIDAVDYGLDRWKGRLASTCVLLNSKDVGLVPFQTVCGQSVFPRNLAAASLLGEDVLQRLRSMVVFDALICNTDRHGGNYGFLRDNASGRILSLAPLYDHNQSLFALDMEGDFPSWLDGSRARSLDPKTGPRSFDGQAAAVMGPLQHEQLRRLIGFELENHPVHPMDERRLASLNGYLRLRVRELLSIKVVDEKRFSSGLLGILGEGGHGERGGAPFGRASAADGLKRP